MKTQRRPWCAVFVLFIGLVVVLALSGCETCKGFGRDIKNADEWMKDNLW